MFANIIKQTLKQAGAKLRLFALYITVMMPTFASELKISAQSEIYDSYQNVISKTSCNDIDNYRNYPHRGLVELILLCKVLTDVADIEIVRAPNYSRALQMAVNGSVHMPAESVWNFEIPKQGFYATEPIIADGEFVVGLFTSPENAKALKVKDKDSLSSLTAVSSPNWKVDWQILSKLNLKSLYKASTLQQMANMVNTHRADFLLWKFSGKADLSSTIGGVKLVPIRKLKLKLYGSRHFIISKKHPNSKIIFETLNRKLKIMRQQGKIKSIFLESGFYTDAIKDWHSIN